MWQIYYFLTQFVNTFKFSVLQLINSESFISPNKFILSQKTCLQFIVFQKQSMFCHHAASNCKLCNQTKTLLNTNSVAFSLAESREAIFDNYIS